MTLVKSSWLVNIIVWGICLALVAIVFSTSDVEDVTTHNDLVSQKPDFDLVIIFGVGQIFNLLIFHFNTSRLAPRYLRDEPGLYAVIIAGLVIMSLVIEFLIMNFLMSTSSKDQVIILLINAVIIGLLLTTSVSYFSFLEKQKNEQRLVEIELALLRHQLNPHFLLNTMNNVYSMVTMGDTKIAAKGISLLSKLMRYSLNESAENMVPLEKEIEYIESYVELQKLRFGVDDPVRITLNTEMNGGSIAPMIMMTFIENAFTHGINHERYSFVDILIKSDTSKILFEVTNSDHSDATSVNGRGIGIRNSLERLELLYSGRYRMDTKIENGSYKVNLELKL